MAHLVQVSANDPLDVLLEQLCIEMGLTRAQHERAARAYTTVGNWLTGDEGLLGQLVPRVFPQGSIPLGTATRPRGSEDFDADGVCLLTGASGLQPALVYRLVLDRIRQHEAYRDRVSEQPRCIRLDYEGNLHLDIVPAVPAPRGILVPNRDRTAWQESDPEGYGDWFHAVASPKVIIGARLDAEPMPPFQEVGERTVLARSVQLAKRRREVFFENQSGKPKSILLTTLAGVKWSGADLVADGLIGVLRRLVQEYPIGSRPRVVPNPVNGKENLARHWHEEAGAYSAFTTFVSEFFREMTLLQATKGLELLAQRLRDMFDPQDSGLVKAAVERSTARFQDDRAAQRILATSSRRMGGAVAAIIPPNRFFGR